MPRRSMSSGAPRGREGGTERERERESETGRDAEANTQIKNIRKTFKI